MFHLLHSVYVYSCKRQQVTFQYLFICCQVALLSPYQSVLYTWDDPSKERLLLWNVYNKKSKGFVAEFWKVRIINLRVL
jgi:hypothetical protein